MAQPWGWGGGLQTLLSCQGWAQVACRLCGLVSCPARSSACLAGPALCHLPPLARGSRTFPWAQLRTEPPAGSFRPVLASSCPQEQAGLPARRAPSPFVSLRMCVQVLPLETTSYFLLLPLFPLLASFEERGVERQPCGCCRFRCVRRPRKSKARVGRGFQELTVGRSACEKVRGSGYRPWTSHSGSPRLFSSSLVVAWQ